MEENPIKPKRSALKKTFIGLITTIIIPIIWLFSDFVTMDKKPETPVVEEILPQPWPPIVGQTYPDLELIDQAGETFKLSYLKGKVIVIEPTGMNCPACQAFSGAHLVGAYKSRNAAVGLQSFREIFPMYAKGLKLPHHDVIFVDLLLYDMSMGHPTVQDAKEWAQHFHLTRGKNHFVAINSYDLRNKDTYNLIPGFQLIDRNFILRADSTGHRPKHDLYRQLIPLTTRLLAEKPQAQ